MKPSKSKGSTRKPFAKPKAAASRSGIAVRGAAIFRNGRNQAVRLPQELRFADDVKEVRIRRQGDRLLLSPIRPDWASLFAPDVSVPEDFLADRVDSPPQSRDPL